MKLTTYANPGEKTASIWIDTVGMVGNIKLVAAQTYGAEITHKRVNGFDGITGNSVRDVHGKIAAVVRAGKVSYVNPVGVTTFETSPPPGA